MKPVPCSGVPRAHPPRRGARRRWPVLLLLVLAGADWAAAQHKFDLQVASVTWRGRDGTGYDVFDETPYVQTVNFTVQHIGNAGPFFVTFSKNTPGQEPRLLRAGTETLAYQIYDTTTLANVLKDLPTATQNEVISGSFPSGNETRTLSFVLAMPARQIRPAGTYADTVTVSLYSGTRAQYQLERSVAIQVTAPVPQLVGLALVPTGGGFAPEATAHLLEFGSLAAGRELGLDLRVRSNAGYSVSLQSQNGGVLRHATVPTDTVPYTLEIGGAPVLLGTQAEVFLTRRGVITGPNGEPHPILVRLGAPGEAGAGRYTDIVTITVRAEN